MNYEQFARPRRHGQVRGLLAMALLMPVVLAVSLAVAARAADSSPRIMTPAEAKSGTLLLRTKTQGRFIAAPRLGTDVDITVSGPTARTRLTQHFVNPAEGYVEALYVFPLPESAAVDTLKLIIGERVIIGDVKERQEAKRIYEKAKREGKKAALMVQERPNMFTQQIANIGPGESVVVQIEYQQAAHRSGAELSLRVPLVVGPRYNPKPLVQSVDLRPGGGGWGRLSDPVPDRARITPPVLDPAHNPPVNPVTISVRLQAGFPLGDVKSLHHQVAIKAEGDDISVLRLKEGVVPADRDFVLTWTAKAAPAPSVGLFKERVGGEDYVLAFVTPPALKDAVAPKPRGRDVVFVIDTSGSMGGTSIVQARASLDYALSRLKPLDRFNVIQFSDTFSALHSDVVPASPLAIAAARTFVAALQAGGGTEMLGPLLAALRDQRPQEASRLRQVMFLTDGAVGNEAQLFEMIGRNRGRSRLFMVGIGSAPNSHLMTRAAEIGRGTFTHIGATHQVEAQMRALFEKLESPAVTGLSAAFDGAKADRTPALLPDLYRGEPLVIAARMTTLAGSLKISGHIGDRPWQVSLPLASAAQGKGISKVWARRKIADAEVALRLSLLDRAEADKRILQVALAHHLVSRLTSLVAVDATPSRPAGVRLTRADVPLNLPAGWDFEKVFGRPRLGPDRQKADAVPGAARRQRASVDRARLQRSAYSQVAAANKPMSQALVRSAMHRTSSVALPGTATDAELRLLVGLALLMLALVWLAVIRRRHGPGTA